MILATNGRLKAHMYNSTAHCVQCPRAFQASCCNLVTPCTQSKQAAQASKLQQQQQQQGLSQGLQRARWQLPLTARVLLRLYWRTLLLHSFWVVVEIVVRCVCASICPSAALYSAVLYCAVLSCIASNTHRHLSSSCIICKPFESTYHPLKTA